MSWKDVSVPYASPIPDCINGWKCRGSGQKEEQEGTRKMYFLERLNHFSDTVICVYHKDINMMSTMYCSKDIVQKLASYLLFKLSFCSVSLLLRDLVYLYEFIPIVQTYHAEGNCVGGQLMSGVLSGHIY